MYARGHDSTFHLRAGRSVFQIAGNYFFRVQLLFKEITVESANGDTARRHLCTPLSSSPSAGFLLRGAVRAREEKWKESRRVNERKDWVVPGSRSLDVTNKGCVEKGNDGPHNAVLINEATLSVRVRTSLFLFLSLFLSLLLLVFLLPFFTRERTRGPVSHATTVPPLFHKAKIGSISRPRNRKACALDEWRVLSYATKVPSCFLCNNNQHKN